MDTAYYYLAFSGVLTLLLWTPYILARIVTWGIPTFLNNYPEGFPKEQPEPPVWAQRAQRAHLNMVETMPAFIAVVVGAGLIAPESAHENIVTLSQLFFYSRLAYSFVYTAGIPYLRTPVYLVSWAAILLIAANFML